MQFMRKRRYRQRFGAPESLCYCHRMPPKPQSPVASAAATPDYEQSLAQLEALVTRLESGDLPLEEALASFEQGVRLTRDCQGALNAAQQKVQLLLQRGEGLVAEDFIPSAEGESPAAE
jgi:exodeoxyribonuclease VII small subunit